MKSKAYVYRGATYSRKSDAMKAARDRARDRNQKVSDEVDQIHEVVSPWWLAEEKRIKTLEDLAK